jgi:hypothetical protein
MAAMEGAGIGTAGVGGRTAGVGEDGGGRGRHSGIGGRTAGFGDRHSGTGERTAGGRGPAFGDRGGSRSLRPCPVARALGLHSARDVSIGGIRLSARGRRRRRRRRQGITPSPIPECRPPIPAQHRKPPAPEGTGGFCLQPWIGGDVLSHRGNPAVPSALRGLTSEFGMGSGDPPRYSHRSRERSDRIRRLGNRVSGSSTSPGYCLRVLDAVRPVPNEPVKPHGPLVRLGFTYRYASTCRLSTWWSSTALQGSCDPGGLILGGASHLDAFSGSPFPT